MNDRTAGAGFLFDRRPPFWRFAASLYTGNQVFRSFVDFAAIGGIVLLFMHPPSAEWFNVSRLSNIFASAPSAPAPAPPSGATLPQSPQSQAAPPPTVADHKPVTPAATTSAPAASDAPTQPRPGAASTGIGMPAVEDVRRPRMDYRFLVAIDETAFRSSAPADQARLAKAATAFRARRYSDVLDSLVGSAPTDPNVVFMRGLAAIHQTDFDHFRRAVEQLRAAAAGGHVQAGTVAGALLVSGVQAVPKDVAEGKRLIEAAAARGDSMAQRAAGIGYLGGEFGVLDPFKGASFIKSAAEAGDPSAMLHYAYLLSTGAVVEKNERAAEDLVLRTAEAGLTAAQETLGMWIIERYKAGLISDPSEGIRWLERAYQRGLSIMALNRLGVFYVDEGRNPPWKDAQKALALFQMCASFTFPNCHFAYATSLHFGRGTAKDPGKAYVHYELARQLGSTGAPARLKRLDELLAPAEKEAALEAARAQRGELKPSPRNIVLQYVDVPEPASPWPIAPSTEGARAMPTEQR